MSDVKRYDLEQPDSHMGSAKMQREEYGDWVSFEDYTALRARLDAVEQIGLAFEVDAGEQRERAERAEAALATARQLVTHAATELAQSAQDMNAMRAERALHKAIRALANEAET